MIRRPPPKSNNAMAETPLPLTHGSLYKRAFSMLDNLISSAEPTHYLAQGDGRRREFAKHAQNAFEAVNAPLQSLSNASNSAQTFLKV
jgi:hypothetical protein